MVGSYDNVVWEDDPSGWVYYDETTPYVKSGSFTYSATQGGTDCKFEISMYPVENYTMPNVNAKMTLTHYYRAFPTTYNSTNVKITTNGGTAQASTGFGTWQDITGFTLGSNTIKFSVGGSYKVYYQVEYVYDTINVHVNVGGTYKLVDAAYANVDGVWKPIQSIYVNSGGVWKNS